MAGLRIEGFVRPGARNSASDSGRERDPVMGYVQRRVEDFGEVFPQP